MPLAPRHLPRLTATVSLFTKYGLKDFAVGQGLRVIAPEEFTDDENEQTDVAERATAFRKRLVELGPAFVKLGQVLSTRPDLLPDQYIAELEHLQDDVGPIPLSEVEDLIQSQLGGRLSKLFASFDENPIGTASLGQVHAAELRDGRAVVVKVQRPGIRDTLAQDMEFFHEVAEFLTAHTEAGHRIDMIGVIQQLERAIADELDYRTEARNAAVFRRSLAGFPRILIPKVVEAYSSERVLTTERIRGVKIQDIPPVTRIEHDFEPLADEFAKAYLQQITIDGHFHADPHPGNVFIILPGVDNPRTPSEVAAGERRTERRDAVTAIGKIEQEAQADAAATPPPDGPKLALIDFGMTARLPEALKDKVVRLLLSMADNRGDAAADTLIEMGKTTETFDRTGYTSDIAGLIARNYDRSIGDLQSGAAMYEMINISYQRGLRLPSELTMLAKAMFNLDAVSRALDPNYNPVDAIRSYGNKIASDRAKKELSPSRLFQIATQTSDLLTVLPHRIDVISNRLAAGEFMLRIDTPAVPVLLQALHKIANRIFSGLVLCGLLVASSMLMPYRRSLGTTGFVIAAALGLYMVTSILLGDRKSRKK